jgi:hypothetical protein
MKVQIGIFAGAFLLLFLTLFIPRTISTLEETQNIRLGYPVPFVEQDLSYDVPLPYRYSLTSPRLNPTRVLGGNAVVSYALMLGALELVVLVARLSQKRKGIAGSPGDPSTSGNRRA